MRQKRTFKAKVLGTRLGLPVDVQVLHFADIDDEFSEDDLDAPRHDLTNPFDCLEFVIQQVRKRHTMASVIDFQVTMSVITYYDDGSMGQDEHNVRPWKEAGSEAKFTHHYITR